MTLHLSIHDVSPRWSDEIETILGWAHRYELRPALLVVPNYHGQFPLEQAEAFCARLRALEDGSAAGPHEIYLHGFYHREERAGVQRREEVEPRASRPADEEGAGPRAGVLAQLGRRARTAYYQRFVSSGEAEFAELSRERAAELLVRGKEILAHAGLHPTGFVAPAWSMPGWLRPMLAEHGFRFTEDHLRVYDPTTGRSRFTVLLNYATRTRARLLTTTAFARLGRYAVPLAPVRLAIHPGDLRSGLLRREIVRLLAWASTKEVASGRQLLDKGSFGEL